jgi:ribosome-associated protein
MSEPLVVNERITIPAADLTFTATRSSGPGGQNVNKVSSRVELRFDLEGTTALAAPTKARLRTIAKSYLDAEGRIFIRSERTRDRLQNLGDAREKLRLMIVAALVVPKKRRATKPTYGSTMRRLESKSKQSDKKRARQNDGD